MRTKDKTVDLANLDFQRFKDNMRQAIEYFSGSPVKKEAKVFEACAIALGDENSDRLAATMKQTELEMGSALTFAKAGLCPFTKEQLDSDLVQRLGTKCHVDDTHDQLVVERFPEGMQEEDRALWISTQPSNEVVISEGAMKASKMTNKAPHLHAAIAGYREDLPNWFVSASDKRAAHTVCYWHSDDESFKYLPLAARLQYETHFELVLSLADNGNIQSIHLYRIFKIGNSWHLSQDASVSLSFDRTWVDETLAMSGDLYAFLSLLIEQAVQRPARWKAQGADPKSPDFMALIQKTVEIHPICRDNIHLKDSALDMINNTLRSFDYPIAMANRLASPVIHPVR